jgi:sugar phosphate isomerase/epimerase
MSVASMNELTTFRWSFAEDVARFQAAGFRAIGVWRRKLMDFGEERGRELLAEAGLEVSNLMWAGGFTGSDGRSHRESVDDAREAIRLAAELKAGCLILYTGGRGGHTHNYVRKIAVETLQSLAREAEAVGVRLALEPMHAKCATEWTFLTQLDEAIAVMDRVDRPHLQLALDTYHHGLDPRLWERISELAPRLAVVHLGDVAEGPRIDADRTPLGQGRVELGRIVRELRGNGFRGSFDVLVSGHDLSVERYPALLEQSRAEIERLEAA